TGHRMPPPPCYLDECVDQGAAQILRERGNAATTVHDHGMRGAADDEQLEFAAQRGWVLVSHNERHFLRMHRTYGAQGRSHAGILIVPETPSPRGRIRLARLVLRIAMLLDWLATMPSHQDRFIRCGDLQYELTQGLRL